MSISHRPYGTDPQGKTVTEYTMTNSLGASVSVIDYGGTLTRIVVPDRDGKLVDVCLGYDSAEPYAGSVGSMGALIGRVGNRIGGASFELDGTAYSLDRNSSGRDCLHGGLKGYHQRMWKLRTHHGKEGDEVICSLVSPDGDQGFPGELRVMVTYVWNDACELCIRYNAHCDANTLFNPTNHAYFNLGGHASGSVEDHLLTLHADAITAVDEGLIPTGVLESLDGKPYDFRQPKRVGDALAHIADDPTLTLGGGLDFNYCMGFDRIMKPCALLVCPQTGIEMEVQTDLPGVQVYSANGLKGENAKDGASYGRFGGICLETQRYPDAIHHKEFASIALRPEELFFSESVYQFRVSQ